MTTRDEPTRANKECTPTVIRVEPMLHLECSLPHIALRQGPACTSLLDFFMFSPTVYYLLPMGIISHMGNKNKRPAAETAGRFYFAQRSTSF